MLSLLSQDKCFDTGTIGLGIFGLGTPGLPGVGFLVLGNSHPQFGIPSLGNLNLSILVPPVWVPRYGYPGYSQSV